MISQIITRILEIIKAPISNPDMIWIALPLVISIIIMEFYFGRYKKEQLGWNSAVSNSLVLIFVCMNLFQFLYKSSALMPQWVVVFSVFFLGVIMSTLNFLHLLPEKAAFSLTSNLPVNILLYITITVVYSKVPMDIITLISVLLTMVILLLILKLFWFLIPEDVEEAIEE